MSMVKRDGIFLEKILEEVIVAVDLIKGLDYPAFENNEMAKRAVCMTLINIGELAKGLSSDFRQSNTDIPWRSIIGLRDIAAHKYKSLRMDFVWEVATQDIPMLQNQIINILDANKAE